jgi:large subunit ribosomal protein L18
MARGPRYKVPRKRRREGKTNYYRRYRMVISGRKIRAVVRRTNKHIIVQITKFEATGDKTLVAVTSKALRKYGWLGDLKNTPAAYLTGFLAGLLAKKAGISHAILDIGLHPSVKGSRIYAAVKGLIDAGVEIPVSSEVLPSEDRISGKHIAAYSSSLENENPEKYNRIFSGILSRGLNPKKLPEHFLEVKNKILSTMKGG